MKGKTFRSFLSGIMNGVVRLLFAGIVIYLTLLAGFSTSAVSDSERTFLLRDSIVLNLLGEAVFLLLLTAAARLFYRRSTDLGRSAGLRRIRTGCLTAAAVLASLSVLLTQKLPNADQKQVFECVQAIVRNDPAPFEPGGYLEMYPYQSGIIWFTYAVSRLFGMENYLLFQCINILCLIWMMKSFADIADLSGWDEVAGTICLVLCALFVPISLYVNFIYGTLIGLALTLAAFRSALYFGREAKAAHAVRSVLFMLGAVIVKTNYMIFLIGLIACLVREWLRTGRHRYAPLIVAMAAVLFANGSLSVSLIEAASGRQLGKGVNSWAWVAMGLSENTEKYNGWWNHYTNGTYRASGFENAAQGETAKAEVLRRLGDFAREPRRGVKFFSGKNASQWNNPDFEAYCFFRFMRDNEHLEPVRWVYRLFTVEWGARLHAALNLLQFILLFGVLLYLVRTPLREDPAFFYEIVVIGGMIFHTVWEAKSQYTLTYFLLFIPLAAKGYSEFLSCTLPADTRSQKRFRPRDAVLAAVFAAALLLIGSRRFSLINNIFMPGDDRAAYEEYLAANTFVRVPEGEYLLLPAAQPESGLALDGEEARMEPGAGRLPLKLSWPDATDDVLLAAPDGKTLASYGQYPREGQTVTGAPVSGSADERWKLVRDEAEGWVYVLFRDGFALTCREDGRLVLSAMAFEERQRFILQPLQ